MKLFTLFVIAINGFFVDAMHGGQIGKIEQVPYMAEIRNVYIDGDGEDFCGAAILSKDWILTAAHCTQNEEGLLFQQVRVKTYKTLGKEGEFYNISKVFVHKKYSTDGRWTSDISLIKLEAPIKLDEKSEPISISKKTPKAGQIINISGYGYDKDEYVDDLKLGQQTVMSPKACRKAYERASQSNITIDNRVFCTDSTPLDLCGGDSGSPAVMNGKLVGVAVEGCESPLPNVYVNVAHYYSWIRYVTGLKFKL